MLSFSLRSFLSVNLNRKHNSTWNSPSFPAFSYSNYSIPSSTPSQSILSYFLCSFEATSFYTASFFQKFLPQLLSNPFHVSSSVFSSKFFHSSFLGSSQLLLLIPNIPLPVLWELLLILFLVSSSALSYSILSFFLGLSALNSFPVSSSVLSKLHPIPFTVSSRQFTSFLRLPKLENQFLVFR